jgi:hypothetical protein
VTPSLFDLPLRLGDAAALADILLDILGAQGRAITDDQRNRAVSRASALNFNQMRPLIGSLERDPVHPGACYVCVDGVDDQPLLLRAAPATTPSSGLFPKAILIGRTHIGSREVVLNAIPFGPDDHDRIAVFSEDVNKAFQPRPWGSRPVIVVRSETPARTFPQAFEAFRRLLKSTGINQAGFGLSEGQDSVDFCFATIWAAIRAGWREGYAMQGPSNVTVPGLKRRMFESELAVARVVELSEDASTDEIAGL